MPRALSPSASTVLFSTIIYGILQPAVLLYFVGQFTVGRRETDDQEIIAEVTGSAE